MSTDEMIVSAPGKLILHGEHAVVYGKPALAASLNHRTYLKLSKNTLGCVELDLPDVGIHKSWSIERIRNLQESLPVIEILNPGLPSPERIATLRQFTQVDETDINTHHLALVAFLHVFTAIIDRHMELSGLRIQVGSYLPAGAGLGSSAAYSTCLAASLLVLTGHVTPPDVINQSNKATWTDPSDLELINQWAFQSEKIIHGNPSGIDNSVSTFGGALTFCSGKITPLKETPQLEILLINTCQSRSTKLLVAGVRQRYDKYPTVIKPIMDSIEAITQTCIKTLSEIALKTITIDASEVSSASKIHSKDESALDKTTESSDAGKSFQTLTELIDMNQSLLASLGVSHPKLAHVIQICGDYELSAKLTGAGGGGCAFALIPPGTSQDMLQELHGLLTFKGYDCWLTHVGGAGVTFHRNVEDKQLPKSLQSGRLDLNQ